MSKIRYRLDDNYDLDPYDRSTGEWDLHFIDTWIVSMNIRRNVILKLVSIDADSADAIENVGFGMPLEMTLVD